MYKNFVKGSIVTALLIGSLSFAQNAFAQSNGDSINKTTQQLHTEVVKNGYASLNDNGQIVINANAEDLNVSGELFNQYLVEMGQLNDGITEGVMNFNEDFQIEFATQEEILENLETEAPQVVIEDENSEITVIEKSPKFGVLRVVDGGYPKKNIQSLVENNRKQFEKIYKDNLTAQKYSGGNSVNAYNATASWFVAKVQPGGSWDYKVVSGYKPWDNKINGYFYSGYKVVNAAYIGNYNYSYTGELLFSKNDLLRAGDAVSAVTTFISNAKKGKFKAQFDGEDDKIPVRKGYDDAVKYFK
ncbi:hypothetical protein CEQ21_24315 [Niallia circulans]|uniref:Uncharacterized protein n=1 Tax=Niallia circulans TaxID=1397 RepID=A0A553SND9_NIACI|nr:polymorphic toxin type 44 domain-containing protein [Niallia circulans]TRZ38514.1 hypothetical protein CEQ21_24315 [Niallia circulans]